MSDIAYPKPDSEKEKAKKKAELNRRRLKFTADVKRLDNYRCQNFMLVHEMRPKGLHAHHITGKGVNRPELDEVWNGIALCPPCHELVHKDKNEMIKILNNLRESHGEIRQERALFELKKKRG